MRNDLALPHLRLFPGPFTVNEFLATGHIGVYRLISAGVSYAAKLSPTGSVEACQLANEARALKALNTIVGEYHCRDGIGENTCWLLNRWIAGPSLSDIAAQSRDPAFLAYVAGEVVSPVSELRAAGWVHGDIKPAHFRFESVRRRFVLLDLECAYKLSGEPLPSIGSARFSSPELAEAYLEQRQVAPSPADDVFALGTVLHELLFGVSPFQCDRTASVQEHWAAAAGRRFHPVRVDRDSPLRPYQAFIRGALQAAPRERLTALEEIARISRSRG